MKVTVVPTASRARTISVITTLIALAILGFIKGCFTGAPPIRSASQTVLIGGLAAAVAFMIARVIMILTESQSKEVNDGREKHD